MSIRIQTSLVILLLLFLSLPVVHVNAQTPSPGVSCTNAIPTSAPNLYQVTSAKDSATLYFAPPSSGFDGFTISYGLDQNADAYNATLSQGPTSGAVTYTVNSLTPNTKYYFKVRANNGCAPGPWSNVMSSSSGSSSTATGSTTGTTPPVTGPTDVLYLGIAAFLLSMGGLGVFIKNK